MTVGYSYVGIWDNYGNPIQVLPIDEVPARAAVLSKPVARPRIPLLGRRRCARRR